VDRPPDEADRAKPPPPPLDYAPSDGPSDSPGISILVTLFRLMVAGAGLALLIAADQFFSSPYWREGIPCLIAGILLMVIPPAFMIASWVRQRRK
jgi:hypothetical protein